jgi:hypothetical protein
VRIRTTLAILAAAAGLALAAPTAQADKVTATITPVGPGEANYTGKVKAKRDTCAKGRTVEVYDLSEGGYYIAGARTDKKGNWQAFDYVPQPGQQVRIAVPATNKGKGRCKALSTIVEVPENVVIQER